MAKGFFKTLIAGAAIAGAGYAVYKNKDKVMELKNKYLGGDFSNDDIFDEEDMHDENATVEKYDTTNDGKVDTVAIDHSGDGRPDEVIVDTTGDGKADTKYVDTTGDGVVDTVVDLNKE